MLSRWSCRGVSAFSESHPAVCPKSSVEQRANKSEARLKEVEEQLMETRSRLLTFHNEMEAVEQAKDSVEQRNQELEKELEYSGSQMQQLEDQQVVTLVGI